MNLPRPTLLTVLPSAKVTSLEPYYGQAVLSGSTSTVPCRSRYRFSSQLFSFFLSFPSPFLLFSLLSFAMACSGSMWDVSSPKPELEPGLRL